METITEQKLRNIIKEGVREALADELMKLRALALPEVLKREQWDIEKRYKKPSRRIVKKISIDL